MSKLYNFRICGIDIDILTLRMTLNPKKKIVSEMDYTVKITRKRVIAPDVICLFSNYIFAF